MKRTLLAGLVAASLLLAACDPGLGNGSKSVTIEGVNWSVHNIATDWDSWSSPPSQTLYYRFVIDLAGNFSAEDIEYVRVYPPGSSNPWIFQDYNNDGILDGYDAINRRIGVSHYWYTGGGHALPLGQCRAEVGLSSGSSDSFTFTTVNAGETSSPGISHSISENNTETLSSPANTIPRATHVASIKNSGTLTMQFTLPGSGAAKVYDAIIEFSDASGDYVASTDTFRNPSNNQWRSFINSGAGLHADGSTETAVLPDGDLNYASGRTNADIARYRIILFDGAQFSVGGQYSEYFSHRSISGLMSF